MIRPQKITLGECAKWHSRAADLNQSVNWRPFRSSPPSGEAKAKRSRGSVASQTPTPEARARAEKLECDWLGVRLERGVHEV